MKWFRKKEKEKAKENPTVSLEEQRAEKLAKMGAQLKATREQHGFSLEEVVMHTRIPRRLVKGIEEANFEDLPEPVYIKGLVRQYADALGYKGVEFVSTFPVGTNKVSLKPIWKNPSFAQLRPIHLYLLYVLLILGAVSGLSNWLSDATNIATENKSQQKPDILVSNSKPTPIKPESLSQINTFTKDEKGVQIGVTLKESSWIQVIADGKITFEGTLKQGSKRTWKAQKELTVKADNAGGVLVSVNQQEAKRMGKSGKVEQLRVALN
ncbi:MAG: helix-turn-helix domain-containing protein [Richelia sp. RM2_1_2]|nr:helix-turn-helix domain-containing protein [Richelia sp. SM1_7_0]NJN06595.1 helix-turn-helix domain-containing protein [Richelia sp. RM1_1_1]NJO30066.1 helix-turn-helix domain-containing protein [Richelia sp. SL_2_1]NJO58417.1 helix-turn-helix domain-containing protein [Richelia sp. RM2_1_2]